MKKTLLFILSIGMASVNAEPLTVGSQLNAFTLLDQNELKHKIDESTRLILFSKDMDGNAVLKNALEGKNAQYLTEKNIAYVNDISGMPKVITFLFAKPKMRSYEYPMLLDEVPAPTKDFPAQQGQATLIHLNKLTIQSVEYTTDSSHVTEVLEKLNN